ncbi:sensor domain-containing protein [Paenibacillus sp. CAU 1782]
MRKPSALLAWKMLITALPKGIVAFIIIVAGLSASLPLSIIFIGVPLLVGTLALSRKMLVNEARYAEGWLAGKEYPAIASEQPLPEAQQGWKQWMMSVLKDSRSYRAILFGILQLPIGIATFTMALVLPIVAFSVMLSPLAYEISMRLFSFNLFENTWGLDQLVNWQLTAAHRSWIAGGVGLILALLLPLMLRGLAYLYAAWILTVAGQEPTHSQVIAPTSTFDERQSSFELAQLELQQY